MAGGDRGGAMGGLPERRRKQNPAAAMMDKYFGRQDGHDDQRQGRSIPDELKGILVDFEDHMLLSRKGGTDGLMRDENQGPGLDREDGR